MKRESSLIFGLWLSAEVMAVPQFDISIVETGPALSQTVSAAFLFDDRMADLIVTSIDEKKRRWVRVYSAENGRFGKDPLVELQLPDDVILTDVCRGSPDIFVFLKRNEAVGFDPLTGRQEHLVGFSSIYTTPVAGAVPSLDFCRDLNDDGRDDFIIPSFDGFEVFVQHDSGFDRSVSVYAPPAMEMTYEDYPWYQPHAIYLADMNFDTRKDLVFWIDDHFIVYPQLENGLFSSRVIGIKTAIDFQFEGVQGISVSMGEEDQSDTVSKALYGLVDLDGDGTTDLVTLSVKSQGVLNKQTTYEMHRGFNDNGRLSFMPDPFARIRSDGIQFEMDEEDFDQDGQMDAVVSSVQIGLGKILAALITGSIKLDLDFYQMREGRYPDKPNVTRKITATFSLSSGDVFFPSVLIADVDGDRLADLLVQEGTDRLKIFPGRDDDRLFARESVDVDVPMPNDPDLVQLSDLNHDGKADLVLQHESPARIVVMMTR